MKQTLPQEVEVWYLIPSLRKEFARIFIKEHKMNQKEAAKVLGVTESAVSQYLKSKRANEIKFSKEEIKEIKKSVERTAKDKKQFMKELYRLCVLFKESKTICKIHMKKDSSIGKDCGVCFD